VGTSDIDAAKSLLRSGAQALAEGRAADAETAFQTALQHAPGFAPANHNLGLIRLRRGDPASALPYLEDAAKAMPSGTTHVALAECYDALGRVEKAIDTYKPALEQSDQDSSVWSSYAQLLEGARRKSEAAEAYRVALEKDPRNIDAALKLGWIIWRETPESAIELLKQTLTAVEQDTTSRIKVQGTLVLFEEWFARIRDGKPPYHASSLDELFFTTAAARLDAMGRDCDTLLEAQPGAPWPSMTRGLVDFAQGDHESAQAHFAQVAAATGNPMAGSIRFDPTFFDEISATTDADLLNGLPPVETVRSATFLANDVLYMACNASYFDAFAVPLLRSLAATASGTQVHIHLMDSDPGHTATADAFCASLTELAIALSVERPDLSGADIMTARAYFHAIRFIRFYHHVQIYDKTLWLMDVDGLFNLPPDTFFDAARGSDVAMRVRPGRLEPWNQFNACLFGVAPTSNAEKYLHATAAYIAHFYRKGPLAWGIDQLAMYSAYVDCQRRGTAPSVYLLDEKVLDYEYQEDGVLWCSSGSTKFMALNAKDVESNPEATPYDRAFARYSAPQS